jgi:hypothetical protein
MIGIKKSGNIVAHARPRAHMWMRRRVCARKYFELIMLIMRITRATNSRS